MTATFQPQVILITGAASSIGEATAHRLAGQGHCVVLGARRTERLVAIVAAIRGAGGTADCFALDVGSRDSLRDFAAFAEDIHGRCDAIVDHAGVTRPGLREFLSDPAVQYDSGPATTGMQRDARGRSQQGHQ